MTASQNLFTRAVRYACRGWRVTLIAIRTFDAREHADAALRNALRIQHLHGIHGLSGFLTAVQLAAFAISAADAAYHIYETARRLFDGEDDGK